MADVHIKNLVTSIDVFHTAIMCQFQSNSSTFIVKLLNTKYAEL